VKVEVKVKAEMYKTFTEMPVWKDAMSVAEEIFTLSEKFPKKEDYGITSQIRRSAVSISANIAEAFGRHHTLDKIKFYYIARGSVTETQSHLEYTRRVRYIATCDYQKIDKKLSELYKDINKIICTLRK